MSKYEIQNVKDFATTGYHDTSPQVLTDILNGVKTVEEVRAEIDRVLDLPNVVTIGKRLKHTTFNKEGKITKGPILSNGNHYVEVSWDDKTFANKIVLLDNDVFLLED